MRWVQALFVRAVGLGLFTGVSVGVGTLSNACAPSSGDAAVAPADDFQSQVRPILAEHCFGCHGADSARRAAGLRLDRADAVFEARANGNPVILRGNAAASLLVQRIKDTGARRMPPPASSAGLDAEEIEIIERWIDAGAR